jgi:uncharacterized membrane protein (UPF0127 family)
MIKLMALNYNNNMTVAANVSVVDTFFSRLRGLLGTPILPAGHALLIRPCNSVHTFGMRYSIDVVFLDKNGQVVKVTANLSPLCMAGCRKAAMALELPVGTANHAGIEVGHRIDIVNESI